MNPVTGAQAETGSVLELVGDARAALERAKVSLLEPAPASLEQCTRPLTEVVERLRQLKAEMEAAGGPAPPDDATPDLENLAQALQHDLEEVRGLLQQAGAFYLGWSRILASAAGTYTADRTIKTPAGEGLSVQG